MFFGEDPISIFLFFLSNPYIIKKILNPDAIEYAISYDKNKKIGFIVIGKKINNNKIVKCSFSLYDDMVIKTKTINNKKLNKYNFIIIANKGIIGQINISYNFTVNNNKHKLIKSYSKNKNLIFLEIDKNLPFNKKLEIFITIKNNYGLSFVFKVNCITESKSTLYNILNIIKNINKKI